jgi:Protein of unknown function (DUF3788)
MKDHCAKPAFAVQFFPILKSQSRSNPHSPLSEARLMHGSGAIKLLLISERKEMDTTNAFIGKAATPTSEEVSSVLGESNEVWKTLIDWFAQQGVAEREWNSFSLKYGWSLRLKLKKRTIVHLSPCNGCFRAAFILGDKAVAAARQSDLSRNILKLIDDATRYAEGTGIRLVVKQKKDLAAIRKLALIKLAN